MSGKSGAEAIAFLESLAPSVIRLGLERIQAALEALGHPERRYPTVQVAGTNGKGSTCALLASALAAAGWRVGLYTSPHLARFGERIQVGGEPISDSMLEQRLQEVLERYPKAREPGELTYFELGTLAALWHFAQERVEVAVLETGLGGRLDATTASCPQVTALTPISMDHLDLLGHTLSAIAGEKAGILKPKVPAVVARQAPEVMEVLERTARELGAPLWLEGRDFALEPEGQGLLYRGMSARAPGLRLGLRGAHQRQNAALALACLELLGPLGLPVSPQALRRGLAEVHWPGRLEELPGLRPEVVLDGAHNPAGAEVLAAALEELYPRRPVHLVFGVLADKDYRQMMGLLFPRCASVQLTPVASPRSLAPPRYLEEAGALCPTVRACASVEEALARARAEAGDGLVVCAGSLYLVGQLRRLLTGS